MTNEKSLCYTHVQQSESIDRIIRFAPIKTTAFGDKDCNSILKSSHLSNMKQSREVICTYEYKELARNLADQKTKGFFTPKVNLL